MRCLKGCYRARSRSNSTATALQAVCTSSSLALWAALSSRCTTTRCNSRPPNRPRFTCCTSRRTRPTGIARTSLPTSCRTCPTVNSRQWAKIRPVAMASTNTSSSQCTRRKPVDLRPVLCYHRLSTNMLNLSMSSLLVWFPTRTLSVCTSPTYGEFAPTHVLMFFMV